LKNAKVDERELTRIVAIVDSMTPHERNNHMIINGSRRRRIASGSGTTVQDVNQLLKQYTQARKMMKTLSGGMMGKKMGKLSSPVLGVWDLDNRPPGSAEARLRTLLDCNSESSGVTNSMLMIRLARFGAKKKPSYRVVVIEKERARDSRAVEVVGHYNPVVNPAVVDLKHERISHWMKCGAQPSITVTRLMKNNPAPAAV